MIKGVGTDLVDVARIQRSLDRFGERFARKILSETELAKFAKQPTASFLAKRFAAKEAVSKALGTGMRAGVHFSMIEVGHKSSGQPTVVLYDMAAERAQVLEIDAWHISISDEKDHALAFVVAEQAG
jgi:holo-[acyl-carrier protein] synthase